MALQSERRSSECTYQTEVDEEAVMRDLLCRLPQLNVIEKETKNNFFTEGRCSDQCNEVSPFFPSRQSIVFGATFVLKQTLTHSHEADSPPSSNDSTTRAGF
jgi:hypothetical protein